MLLLCLAMLCETVAGQFGMTAYAANGQDANASSTMEVSENAVTESPKASEMLSEAMLEEIGAEHEVSGNSASSADFQLRERTDIDKRTAWMGSSISDATDVIQMLQGYAYDGVAQDW